MSGLHAALAFVFLFATAAPSVQTTPPAGTLSSIAVTASGALLTLTTASGSSIVTVPSDAVVRARAVGEQWATVSLRDLKIGEPVTAVADRSGRIVEVDAEYAVVDTRSVVMQDGYIVGTDGVARKLVAAAASIASVPFGAYVELRTDPSTGDVFDAAVSMHPFARAAAAQVAVIFEVRVPVNTPAGSTVYVATNAQNWTANAVRLSPEPGNIWMATVMLAGGTVLQYKYTRGSWATGERDASGADVQNRSLTVVRSGAAQSVHDVVARWADLPS